MLANKGINVLSVSPVIPLQMTRPDHRACTVRSDRRWQKLTYKPLLMHSFLTLIAP